MGLKKAIAEKFAELVAARRAAEEHLAETAKPKRQRRPSLAAVAKQANQTGNVIEMKPDGTIVVLPKPTDDQMTPPKDENEWDQDYGPH
jgi:hypothetical protein